VSPLYGGGSGTRVGGDEIVEAWRNETVDGGDTRQANRIWRVRHATTGPFEKDWGATAESAAASRFRGAGDPGRQPPGAFATRTCC
jgi:hypothetical protein